MTKQSKKSKIEGVTNILKIMIVGLKSGETSLEEAKLIYKCANQIINVGTLQRKYNKARKEKLVPKIAFFEDTFIDEEQFKILKSTLILARNEIKKQKKKAEY